MGNTVWFVKVPGDESVLDKDLTDESVRYTLGQECFRFFV